MLRNKLIRNKKSFNTIIGGVLFFIFSITLTLTSFAWFRDGKFAGGIIRFGDVGIEAIVKNLTSSSIGQSGVSLGSQVDFHLFVDGYSDSLNLVNYDTPRELNKTIFDEVKQNDSLRIVNPTIEPNTGTTSYYLRSKWQIKVNDSIISEENWYTQANIESLPTYNNNWVRYSDGYYYCVNQNVTEINSISDLKLNSNNGISSGEITFFNTTGNGLFIKIEDINFNSSITEIEIQLIIEVIESNETFVNDNWLSLS